MTLEGKDKWREAIDRELVSAHLGVANPDGDPSKLLSALIQWHVDVALDPAVSKKAAALQEIEREACAQVCNEIARGYHLAEMHEATAAGIDCVKAIRARTLA